MIYRRGNTFHLRKRVPLRFRDVEAREVVAISLKTDSPSIARRKADEIWQHYLEGWEADLQGDGGSARRRYEMAREIADRRGFTYLTSPAVAELPFEDILERVKAVPRADGKPNERIGEALLGGVPETGMSVTEALEEFWTITRDHIRGKTADQVRRWKNPRKKAIKNFVAVVGDKPLNEITRADMRLFRDWWNERIDREGLTANSANKDFTHIAHMLRTVDDALGLDLRLPVGNLNIKDTEKRSRLPFSDSWIREKLLADGALNGLNDQARCIVLALINTGARPSEIAGLMKRHIHIDGPIPFIEILPEGRQLKNAAAKRRIPLTGVSFTALQDYLPRAPKGNGMFPDYFGKDAVSATVNKYLRENGLLQSPKHTLYGLRHAFEDRMTAAEPAWPERMKCDVFGHALSRERYGEGASLEHTHRRMSEFAF